MCARFWVLVYSTLRGGESGVHAKQTGCGCRQEEQPSSRRTEQLSSTLSTTKPWDGTGSTHQRLSPGVPRAKQVDQAVGLGHGVLKGGSAVHRQHRALQEERGEAHALRQTRVGQKPEAPRAARGGPHRGLQAALPPEWPGMLHNLRHQQHLPLTSFSSLSGSSLPMMSICWVGYDWW